MHAIKHGINRVASIAEPILEKVARYGPSVARGIKNLTAGRRRKTRGGAIMQRMNFTTGLWTKSTRQFYLDFAYNISSDILEYCISAYFYYNIHILPY